MSRCTKRRQEPYHGESPAGAGLYRDLSFFPVVIWSIGDLLTKLSHSFVFIHCWSVCFTKQARGKGEGKRGEEDNSVAS